MLVVVTRKIKNIYINETQSKLHSIGPKLKSNLVTDFDETTAVRFPKKYSKDVYAYQTVKNSLKFSGAPNEDIVQNHLT